MSKPFIIAELSCNHLGNYERAVRLVEAAAEAGADAVKLQTWDEMTITDFVIPSGPWAGRKLRDLYEECRTPWEWHAPLFERARRLGMIGFSSVFDGPSLIFLEDIGCPIYKIASFEITDIPLIERVAATGKPSILSTGMATWPEISRAVVAMGNGGIMPTLLKCTSAYPASVEDSNLRAIVRLQKALPQCSIGLSDHTLGIVSAVAATAMGATAIEKHLTLARCDGGPDAGFSSEPHEFKDMVEACRSAKAALGDETLGPVKAEEDSLMFRRALYFTRDMKVGEEIGPLDVRSYRPAFGLPPSRLPDLMGKTVRRSVHRGEPVTGELL